ncbi:MAG TPA: YMGG-like glycine zipper-containing protein [Bacteroidia bacterium]
MKKLIMIVATTFMLGACNNEAKEQAEAESIRQEIIDSISTANHIRQATIDSMKNLEEKQRVVVHHYEQNSTASTEGNQPASTPEKKKGLNNTAKGALIGAGAGAIGGALIDKKRGEGAIVGGLIGAGAGAISGAIIDKQKKKKAEEQKKAEEK